jgi:hypothetical protein
MLIIRTDLSPMFTLQSQQHEQASVLSAILLYVDNSANGYDHQAELCMNIGLPSSLHLPLGAPSQGRFAFVCFYANQQNGFKASFQ